MIVPLQRDEVLLADIRATMARQHGVSLWWLGQSGYLIHFAGVCIAVDPYLSDSLTHKYAATDKPHERISVRVIDPALLSMVSLVTSSHNHTDHLDAETIVPLGGVPLACSAANVDVARERLGAGMPVIGLRRGTPWQHGPFRLHVVPAAHNARETDAHGHERYIGLVIEVGGVTIYHSGDTLWYPELVAELGRWQIDCGLLPINGNVPERRVAGNLDGREAVMLANQVGMGVVVPCHYDMFAFNTVSPDYFEQCARDIRQPYRVLQLGERLDLWGGQ